MRKLIAVLFSLLFATTLVACGDDDADDAGSGADASASDEGASDDDDSDSDATTTTSDDESETTETTEADAGDDSDPEVSGDFCTQAEIFATDESLGNLDFEDPDDVAAAVSLLENFRDAAPDEIKDDLQVIIDNFQLFASALSEAGDDPAAQQAAAAELEEEFAAMNEASTAVQEFTLAECGIDITGGGATTTTTP